MASSFPSLMEFLGTLGEWAMINLLRIIYSSLAIVVGYILYRALTRSLENRMRDQRLGEHLAFTLIRIVRWSIIAAVVSIVFLQFGVTLTVVSGFVTLMGGTIIGFAAVNTLGNAIAGFIVMTSRPFKVGDRIFFNGHFSDVISIDLIYTKLRTIDLVYISVPNQELLKAEIENYGKNNIIRRNIKVTAGYEHDDQYVKKALLEAAGKVDKVLAAPKPIVFITDFQNYAVEYTLHYFIREVKRMPWIDADLRTAVFETSKDYGIDLSTPLLTKRFE